MQYKVPLTGVRDFVINRFNNLNIATSFRENSFSFTVKDVKRSILHCILHQVLRRRVDSKKLSSVCLWLPLLEIICAIQAQESWIISVCGEITWHRTILQIMVSKKLYIHIMSENSLRTVFIDIEHIAKCHKKAS